MKYFWINLDSAEERRNNILQELEKNNIKNHYRVVAYVSPTKSKKDLENTCCRSHLQAVMHFLLDTNDKYALICEDDLTFELKKYWTKTVEEVIEKAPKD